MTVTAKKQWTGESGYCNCLLVAMSRVPVYDLQLFSNRPVPDLVVLTASKPATAAWLSAQEFSYPALNPLTVIQMLSQLARITSMGQWYSFEVYDAVEDNGPVVQRIFHMS